MHIIVEESLQDHVPLAEAALYVTRHYIRPRVNTLIVMENCEDCSKPNKNFQYRLLNHYLKRFNTVGMKLQFFIGEPHDQPLNYNIFIVDSFQSFQQLRSYFPETLHEREFYFLIILTYPALLKHERTYIMHRIFSICMKFNVLNVVIMAEDFDASVMFFSYYHRGKHCVEDLDLTYCGRYKNGSMTHSYLFPLRQTNMNRCTLNVCVNLLPPFLFFDGDTKNPQHLTQSHRLSGIDGDLLNLLSQVMNFSIAIKFEPMSLIGKSNNSTGCFKRLIDNSAHIAIGGFRSSLPDHDLFTVSTTYYQSPYVFVVRGDQCFQPLMQLLRPFNSTVWLFIALAFVVMVVVVIVTEPLIRSRIRKPVCSLVEIFLGNPLSSLPRSNLSRFLIISWTLLCLVLRTVYQGKTFDALRASRMPLPRSISELLPSGYTLIAADYVDFYPQNHTIVRNISYFSRFSLIDKTNYERLTIIAMQDSLTHYNRMHWNSSRLTFIEEPIYLYQLVLYMRKHSIFKFGFDRKIKQLLSAGVVTSLQKLYVNRKFQNMNTVKRLQQIDSEILKGLYVMYFSWMSLAVVVFILELVSKRCERLHRIFLWLVD